VHVFRRVVSCGYPNRLVHVMLSQVFVSPSLLARREKEKGSKCPPPQILAYWKIFALKFKICDWKFSLLGNLWAKFWTFIYLLFGNLQLFVGKLQLLASKLFNPRRCCQQAVVKIDMQKCMGTGNSSLRLGSLLVMLSLLLTVVICMNSCCVPSTIRHFYYLHCVLW